MLNMQAAEKQIWSAAASVAHAAVAALQISLSSYPERVFQQPARVRSYWFKHPRFPLRIRNLNPCFLALLITAIRNPNFHVVCLTHNSSLITYHLSLSHVGHSRNFQVRWPLHLRADVQQHA